MSVVHPKEMVPPEPIRWSLAEYQNLARTGAFAPDARVELMDGVIIKHMPPDPTHSNSIDFARAALATAFAQVACYLRTENPLTLPGNYQPQPDIAVVRGTPAEYRGRFPAPSDVLLLVEVAVSSLDYDRRVKAPAYAAAGLPEYWILNVSDRQLEVFRTPVSGAYTATFTVTETEAVTPLSSPGALVPVRDLLP